MVLLGTPGQNQTKKEIRVVAYKVAGIEYWIATNRYDLSAEDIAMAYKLRWENRKFLCMVETSFKKSITLLQEVNMD